jgi:hypothetical protein
VLLSEWQIAAGIAACFTLGYAAALWAHFNDIFR